MKSLLKGLAVGVVWVVTGCGSASIAPPPPCEPQSCESFGYNCGQADDGCGGTLECGACPEGIACGVVAPNQCGATPCDPLPECPAGTCGTISDGCNGTLECGDCG